MPRPFKPRQQNRDTHRRNENIRIPRIFLIDSDGEKIGEINTSEALEIARRQELDLVEIAPNVRPPVCKIMDFGQFLFEQKKKAKAHRKSKTDVKGIRFGIRISQHDFDTKVKAARKFLGKGHPVKATLQFRGREITHAELGFEKIKEFGEVLSDIAKIEQAPKKTGRQVHMLLSPLPQKQQQKNLAEAAEAAEDE